MKHAVIASIALSTLVLGLPGRAAATPFALFQYDEEFIFRDFQPTLASDLPCRPSAVLAVCLATSLTYYWGEDGSCPECTTGSTIGFSLWDRHPADPDPDHPFGYIRLVSVPQQLVYPHDSVYIRATSATTIPDVWNGTFVGDNDNVSLALTTFGNVQWFGEYFNLSLVLTNPSADGPRFLSQTLGWGTPPPRRRVPEPSTLLLLGTGVIGLAGFRRRRRQ